MAHSIHLYSMHRAVIFAIAQLSCMNSEFYYRNSVYHTTRFMDVSPLRQFAPGRFAPSALVLTE